MAKTSAQKSKQSQGETMNDALELHDLLTLNPETGLITAKKGFVAATLEGKGFDEDTIRDVQDHQMKLLAAAYDAAGKLVHEHAKENPAAAHETYQLQYDVGHHSQTVFFEPSNEKTRMYDVTEHHEPSKGEVTKSMQLLDTMFADLNG